MYHRHAMGNQGLNLLASVDIDNMIDFPPMDRSADLAGHRYEHWRAVQRSAAGRAALHTILQLAAAADLGGRLDPWHTATQAVHLDSVSALTGLPKTDTSLRPICNPMEVRKASGRLLLLLLRPQLSVRFTRSNQLLLAKDGCLVMGLLLRIIHACHLDWVIVTTDKSAAFQRISRNAIRQFLLDHARVIGAE